MNEEDKELTEEEIKQLREDAKNESADESSDASEESRDPENLKEVVASTLESPGAERVPLDVREIPLEDIGESQNTRPAYHGIEALASTMHSQGQLQPCVVRPAPEDAAHDKPFELVCGFRRKRAAEFLREKEVFGWDTLRCEVRDIPDDQRIRQTIVENFQREDLSPVAEARAMLQLKHSAEPPLSNIQVAKELGCDPSQVSHRLRILQLELPPEPEVEPEELLIEEPESVEEPSLGLDAADGSLEGEWAEGDALQDPTDFSETNIEEDEEEAPPKKKAKRVDILEMVDKGEITASTAEVIVSLPDRKTQEKLAILAKRGNWSTKKASRWAKEVQENKIEEAGPEFGPVEMVQIEDVVELPHLRPRPDLSESEIQKITCYALLRNGLDREMLDYLEEEFGVPYESLWDYVAELSDEETDEMIRRLVIRYISAAHRWFSLEPTLKDSLGLPEEASAEDLEEAEALATSLPEQMSEPVLPKAQSPEDALDALLGGQDD